MDQKILIYSEELYLPQILKYKASKDLIIKWTCLSHQINSPFLNSAHKNYKQLSKSDIIKCLNGKKFNCLEIDAIISVKKYKNKKVKRLLTDGLGNGEQAGTLTGMYTSD